jgi:hypothetical protein
MEHFPREDGAQSEQTQGGRALMVFRGCPLGLKGKKEDMELAGFFPLVQKPMRFSFFFCTAWIIYKPASERMYKLVER